MNIIQSKLIALFLMVTVVGGALFIPKPANACFECGLGGGFLPLLGVGFLINELFDDGGGHAITNNNYNYNNNVNNVGAQPATVVAANNNLPVVSVSGTGEPTIYTGQPAYQKISKRALVGELFNFTVSATDPDGDTLQYYALFLPFGSRFDHSNRTFYWTPNSVGNYTARFRVADGNLQHVDLDVLIEVVNSSPVVAVTNSNINYYDYNYSNVYFAGSDNPLTVAREGQLYTYTVQAVSGNNRKLTYRVVNGPQGLTINSSLGTILWVPNFSQGGVTYPVTIGVSDGIREITKSFSIFVTDVAQAQVQLVAPSQPVVQTVKIIEKIVEMEKKTPVVDDADKDEIADNEDNDENEEKEIYIVTLGGIFGALGGVLINPWLLLLVIIILALLLFRSHRREKERQQLAAMEAGYRKAQQESAPVKAASPSRLPIIEGDEDFEDEEK